MVQYALNSCYLAWSYRTSSQLVQDMTEFDPTGQADDDESEENKDLCGGSGQPQAAADAPNVLPPSDHDTASIGEQSPQDGKLLSRQTTYGRSLFQKNEPSSSQGLRPSGSSFNLILADDGAPVAAQPSKEMRRKSLALSHGATTKTRTTPPPPPPSASPPPLPQGPPPNTQAKLLQGAKSKGKKRARAEDVDEHGLSLDGRMKSRVKGGKTNKKIKVSGSLTQPQTGASTSTDAIAGTQTRRTGLRSQSLKVQAIASQDAVGSSSLVKTELATQSQKHKSGTNGGGKGKGK